MTDAQLTLAIITWDVNELKLTVVTPILAPLTRAPPLLVWILSWRVVTVRMSTHSGPRMYSLHKCQLSICWRLYCQRVQPCQWPVSKTIYCLVSDTDNVTDNSNDNNMCTNDTCNPATGCQFTQITCSDNNLCTTDLCNTATGTVMTVVTLRMLFPTNSMQWWKSLHWRSLWQKHWQLHFP